MHAKKSTNNFLVYIFHIATISKYEIGDVCDDSLPILPYYRKIYESLWIITH